MCCVVELHKKNYTVLTLLKNKIIMSMKRIFQFFLICVLLSNTAKASHLFGGEITWACQANGQYIFTLKLYRDCSGIPLSCTDATQLDVSGLPGLCAITLNPACTSADLSPSGGTPNAPCFTCASNDPRAVQEWKWVSNPVTLNGVPPATGWTFSWNSCCRNPLANVGGGGGFTVRAKMFPYNGLNANPCFDSSPYFTERPNTLITTGFQYNYNPFSVDPEQDSLSTTFGNPLDQPSSTCPNFTAPNLPYNPPYSVNNPFPGNPTLNPVTGELIINNLATLGNFAACLKVTAFKCGIKVAEIYRDYALAFQNPVAICGGGTINTPPDVFPPFTSGYDTTVTAGDTIVFVLYGNDFEGSCPAGAPQNVTIESPNDPSANWGTNYSSFNTGCLVPPCATLTSRTTPFGPITLPNTKPISNGVRFVWPTSCSHLNPPFYCPGSNNPKRDYTFVLKVRDNVCPVPGINTSTINIKVIAPDTLLPPEIRCAKVDCGSGDVRLEWEIPGGPAALDTHNYFAKYHIFGSLTGAVGSFVLLDSLEGGKPIFYNKFKDVSSSKLALLGAGITGKTNSIYFQMKTVCGCDSTVFSKPSNVVRSIYATVSKIGTSVPLSWNAVHNPLLPTSSNKYEVWREYPLGTWTKVTDVIGATTYNDSTFVKGLCSDSVTYQIRTTDLLACESRSNCIGLRFTQSISAGINPATPVNLCNGQTATLTATPATGGGVSYTYQWSGAGSGTNQTVTASTTGTYTVTVTQVPSGCTATASKVVNVSAPYNASVSGLTPKCAGQATTLTITTGSTGNWQYWINGPSGQITGTATNNPYNININNLQSSHNYTIDSLKDVNGCKATITGGANILVNPLPTAGITVTNNDTICQGTNATITFNFSGAAGQAPYALTYTSPSGNQVLNTSTNPYVLNVSPPPPSFTYGLVSLTDNNGCVAAASGLTGTRKIVVNPTPTATLSLVQGNDTICFGDSVRLKVDFTGTAPYNITLKDNTTGSLTPINTNATSAFAWVKPNAVGNFNYTLQSFTSSTKLCTGPINNNVLIVVKAIPNANLSALSNTTICSGDSVNLSTAFTGAANYSFVWKPLGGSNITTSNITATPYNYWVKPALGATGYVLLSVTDNFCSRTALNDTVFVQVNPLPTAIISTTTPSICQGTQATLNINFTGTANFSGSWQLQGGGSTNFNTASNPYTFNLNPAVGNNIYQLVGQVTDGNGCKQNVNAATAAVNVIQLPVASLSGNDTACVGSAIQLNVNFPQGTAPYTFYYHNITTGTAGTATNVNPGAGNPYVLNISGLTAGTFNFQLDSVKSAGCKGNVNGAAIGVINPIPVATLTVGSDTICQGTSTSLNINFSTGTGPYTYTLQGQSAVTNAANPIVIPVTTPPVGLNNYSLINIQDKNCASNTNQTVTVRVVPNPTATITSTDSICDGDNANVTVTFVGQGPFSTTYTTNPGGSNTTITNNATSTYSTVVNPAQTVTYSLNNVSVTGLYGCSSVVTNNSTTVVSPKPVAVISGTQSVCRNDSATITINFTTGTPPYSGTYQVNGGSAVNFSGITSNPYVFKIKQATAGVFNYTLSSLNDRYCTAGSANMSGTAAVTVKALPTAVLSGATTICNGVQTNLSIAFTGTGNFVGSYGPVGGPFTNYNTASNPLIIPVNPTLSTSYQLSGVVTDNTGCQNAVSTAAVAVNVTQLPQATISGSDTACAGQGTQLSINFPAGTAPYTFYYHNSTSGTVGTPITTSSNPYTLNVPSLAVGTYNFQLDSVTSFGCKGTVLGTGQVIVKPLPVATITVASDTICEGTSTNYIVNFSTGTAPYTFQLSGGVVQNTNTASTSISISPTAPSTNYTLTNITDKFCAATTNQTVNVKVIKLPTATITSTPSICDQQTATITVNFTGTPPFNATYTTKSPSTSLVTTNIVAHASNTYTATNVLNETTTYTLVGSVSGLYGCSKTVADTHITVVHPKPVSQLVTVDDICIGQQTSLTVNFPVGTAPFNYTLQNNLTGSTTNYSASSSPATINVSPNLTTSYSVIAVTDANNCSATQMTNASTITVHALPQPVIVGDNAICDGQSTILSTATVSPAYTNYVWSQSGATSSTISVNSSGNYSVTVTDVNGCVKTSPSFTFTVNNNPIIDFTNDTSLACEISNINFTNLSTYESNATFAWNLGDNATSTLVSPSHIYSTPGTYPITLTITNPTGCSSTLTKPVDITFFPLPVAKFVADPLATNIYSSGINFYDQSANAVSWQWNFGDDNTSPLQNPSHYFGAVGEYMVKLVVTNIAGCVSEFEQQVVVNPFYLPNAFTPNKDGKNDFFFDPGFTLDVASYKMKIFNRWGQKFFESESTGKSWDGSDPSGARAPQGVYVYSIDVKTKEGRSQQYNGTVTLLR